MLVICYVGVGFFFCSLFVPIFVVCCQSSPRLPGARVSLNDICIETLQVLTSVYVVEDLRLSAILCWVTSWFWCCLCCEG